ncbi:hypothetical protein D3C72_2568430 [compost metagenome]
MVFAVSYIGNDVDRFIRHPGEIIYVLLFIGVSLWGVKAIEARFTRAAQEREEQLPSGESLQRK